jgi:hypothetical protein
VDTTIAGTRRQFRHAFSIGFGGTPLGYSVGKFATQLSFFWLKAVLPIVFTEAFKLVLNA